jgi:hypothetical protein
MRCCICNVCPTYGQHSLLAVLQNRSALLCIHTHKMYRDHRWTFAYSSWLLLRSHFLSVFRTETVADLWLRNNCEAVGQQSAVVSTSVLSHFVFHHVGVTVPVFYNMATAVTMKTGFLGICTYVRMYICMYVWCMCLCMYVRTYVYMYVWCMCMHVCVYVCTYVRMYICMYAWCMCLCMYVRVYVFMYVCMYVCMYVWCMYVCNICTCVCMCVCTHKQRAADMNKFLLTVYCKLTLGVRSFLQFVVSRRVIANSVRFGGITALKIRKCLVFSLCLLQ